MLLPNAASRLLGSWPPQITESYKNPPGAPTQQASSRLYGVYPHANSAAESERELHIPISSWGLVANEASLIEI